MPESLSIESEKRWPNMLLRRRAITCKIYKMFPSRFMKITRFGLIT